MVIPILITLFASFAIGFAVARVVAVAISPLAVGVFYVGLNANLWGNGLGDGWAYAMAILMLVGVVGAACGVAARRGAPRRAQTV